MNLGINQHKAACKEEADDILGELEGWLLDSEDRTDDTAFVGHIFRDLHTLKGSGSMFGFDQIAHFTRQFESVYDLVRKGRFGLRRDVKSSAYVDPTGRQQLNGTAQQVSAVAPSKPAVPSKVASP